MPLKTAVMYKRLAKMVIREAKTRALLLPKRNPIKSGMVMEFSEAVNSRNLGAIHCQAIRENITAEGAKSSQGAP